MALIEGFPDSPRMSPRISFSHDLSPNDAVLVEQHCIRTHSAADADFDFCVFHQESSTADELFFDGKILPIQIKKRLPPPPPPKSAPQSIPPRRQSINEPGSTKCPCSSSSESGEEKQGYKPSFWRIKRSTSLNCGSGYARTLCPLPILSRSNSTGSKRSPPPIPNPKYSSQPHNQSLKHSSSKPPLKKISHPSYSNYGSVIQINPILNVPPANLFGLGSIFSSKKK